MSRIVEVALAVAGVVLYGGYKDIFVPPSAEPMVQGEAARPEAAPEQGVEPAQPYRTDYDVSTVITLPATPADALEDTARKQLEQFYRMPVMDAPVEADPEMVFVPDPSVEYSMPVVVPEPGLVAPRSPQRVLSGDFMIVRGNEPRSEYSIPDAKPEKE